MLARIEEWTPAGRERMPVGTESDSNNQPWSRPQGREAVRNALIAATERLCAERSPGQVSLRQIGSEAGVNHGQVQHYFGSKVALITATMEQIEAELIDRIDGDTGLEFSGLVDFLSDRPAFTRMIAWVILEVEDPKAFAPLRFGTVLAERLQTAGFSSDEARVVAAHIMLLTGGWALLRPAISVATDLDTDGVGLVQQALQERVESLVRSPSRESR
jgi:AcrR family transcriptional regulator